MLKHDIINRLEELKEHKILIKLKDGSIFKTIYSDIENCKDTKFLILNNYNPIINIPYESIESLTPLTSIEK